MIKWLLVLVVVVVVGWLIFGRRRGGNDGAPASPPSRATPPQGRPADMLSCAHCGVHLPASDALLDPAQRAYCSEAHRTAGPH